MTAVQVGDLIVLGIIALDVALRLTRQLWETCYSCGVCDGIGGLPDGLASKIFSIVFDCC